MLSFRSPISLLTPLLLFLFTLWGCAPAADERPNVLFIAIDDMNDWVGYLEGHSGGMEVHTPNLDRLAESSLIFTNAHTPSPACAPARAAVFTGVHPARSGLMRNFGGDGPVWRGSEALSEALTLEQFFRGIGYSTLGGGKLYHTLEPQRTPRSQIETESWDYYFPSHQINLPWQIRAAEEVIRPDHFTPREFGGGDWWTWGPIDIDDDKMSDYQIIDWAIHELNRPHDRPFFLAPGIFRPHSPWEVPAKYFDLYPLEEVRLPEFRVDDLSDAYVHNRRMIHEWVLENDQWEHIVQAYAASVTFADAMIGRLIDALEASPHAGNTIVVLWSDHGMHLGEKENYEKFTLWERSTRVPFLLRVPGMEHAGARTDQPVSLLDIFPTLVELLGHEPLEQFDGISLTDQLRDPGVERRPVVSSYEFPNQVGHTVRTEHFRYIYYTGTGLQELYDHRSDPNEFYNIAYRPGNEAVVERHRGYMLEQVPGLEFRDGDPEGYEIGEDGSVRYLDYVSISIDR